MSHKKGWNGQITRTVNFIDFPRFFERDKFSNYETVLDDKIFSWPPSSQWFKLGSKRSNAEIMQSQNMQNNPLKRRPWHSKFLDLKIKYPGVKYEITIPGDHFARVIPLNGQILGSNMIGYNDNEVLDKNKCVYIRPQGNKDQVFQLETDSYDTQVIIQIEVNTQRPSDRYHHTGYYNRDRRWYDSYTNGNYDSYYGYNNSDRNYGTWGSYDPYGTNYRRDNGYNRYDSKYDRYDSRYDSYNGSYGRSGRYGRYDSYGRYDGGYEPYDKYGSRSSRYDSARRGSYDSRYDYNYDSGSGRGSWNGQPYGRGSWNKYPYGRANRDYRNNCDEDCGPW